jgi:hypothetical protein
MLLTGLTLGIVAIGVLLTVFRYAVKKSFEHRHVSTSVVLGLTIGILVVGVVLQLLAKRLERPLNGSSPQALSASYRLNFFLWVGFGELPTFLGIVAFVVTGQLVTYLAGALFAFVTFARIAPTTAHLDRDEAQLRRGGCMLSLRDALDSTSTGSGAVEPPS